MAKKVNLLFFNFDDSVRLVSDLNAYYKNSNKFEIENIRDVTEVIQYLSTTMSGIFFFKVANKQDLQNAVAILKSQKKNIKKGAIKPACITSIKNKKVETVLAKYGCMEILEPETNAKTISFKLDFWSKPIIVQMEKTEQDEKLQSKKKEATQKKEEKNKPNFKNVAPLELQSDFWIVKHKADYKKVLRRWLIRLLGPSPFVGTWTELEPQPGDKLPTWKYTLKDPSNKDYVLDEGSWFFYGTKPEFDWKINRWSFSSDLPHLYFYTNDGKVFSRFKFENSQVAICDNSQFAMAREEMILSTCDAKYNFDSEKSQEEEVENLDGEGGTDELGNLTGNTKDEAEELGGNLTGKLSAENEDESKDPKKASGYQEDAIDGNMSGKSSTDDLGGGPLSGALKPGQEKDKENKNSTFEEDPFSGNMSGKSSTDDLGGGPLSGAIKPGQEKDKENKNSTFEEDPFSGNMSGKSSTDDLGGGPLSGAIKPGQVKDKEDKNSTFEEDAIAGHMGGKSSTDDLGGGPLSGTIKPGQTKDKENKNSTFEEDAIAGHMGGKSSTDDLGGGPLSGAIKPGQVKDKEDKNSTFEEDAIAGHMGGKSSTDDLGGGPLSGAIKPGQVKDKEDKNSTFEEDAIAGHMGGKSSTDDLGGGPLSGAIKPGQVKDKEDKNSTFEEDAIAGHMGGKSSTDDLGGGPLSGALKPGQEKDKENKNNTFEEDPLAGHMGGKSSTDDLGSGPLSGKLDPTKSATNKPNQPIFEQDPFAGPMDGKSSTDNLNVDPLSGKLDPSALGENREEQGGLPNVELGSPNFSDSNLLDELAKPNLPAGVDGNTVPAANPINPEDMPGLLDKPDELGGKSSDSLPAANEQSIKKEVNPYLDKEDANKKEHHTGDSKYDQGSDGELNPDDLSKYQVMDGFDKDVSKGSEASGSQLIDNKPAPGAEAQNSNSNLFEDLDEKGKEAGKIDHVEESKALKEKQAFPDRAKSADEMIGREINKSKVEREDDMLDALGGGLTDGAFGESESSEKTIFDTIIGEKKEEDIKADDPDLQTVIGGAPDLSLESGELKVVLKQKTDVGNDITFICNFEDFYEDELIVQAPRNSIPVKSEVKASVSLLYNGQKVKVECIGIIEEIEDLSEHKDTLIISISKINKAKYESFMTLYQDRQSSINDFLEMAKGY